MKKSFFVFSLLAALTLTSCARKNCPAYSNTKVEVPTNPR